MDLQSILNLLRDAGAPAGFIGVALSIVSLVLAFVALRITSRETRVNRMNTNSWETYRMYNSDEVKRARKTAREVGKIASWGAVKSQGQYRAFFRLDEPLGDPPNPALQKLRDDEQDLHYLMNYYHQVGMLLNENLLDVDFTMFLLGGGLVDRWNVLGRIPLFFDDTPYDGMYRLHDTYTAWRKERFPLLTRGVVESRAREASALGISDPSL